MNEIEIVMSFRSLYRALKKSCKDVRWKPSVITYEYNAMKNTYKLHQQLVNGTYKLKGYQIFQIHEPKERTIKATKIVDRQFQHSLCDNLVYHQLTKSLISDSCACLLGRGVDYCLDRITKHLVQINGERGTNAWVLKCDVRKYFDSIPHEVAKQAVRKRIQDPQAIYYIEQVIDSFEGDCGIGLGSQLSQLIANAVLDDMDHMIKEQLKIRHYVRYMDDFVLIHEDKEYLKYCRRLIEVRLNRLGLSLNPKSCMYPLSQGVKMLHWHFYIKSSGKILRRMENNRPAKQRRRLSKILQMERAGELPEGTAQKTHMSWLANAKRGDTYIWRKEMHEYYNRLTGGINNETGNIGTACGQT